MNTGTSLLCKVQTFLEEQSLGRERLVLAVSGGPDSVALFRAMVRSCAAERSKDDNPGRALTVAHLNHRLRGAESDGDEEFVRDLVDRLSTEFNAKLHYRCACSDVAACAASEGSNLEDVARRLRYDWLGKVAQETGSPFVASGHTMDDQAETILHRLVRGTGLKGLRGIAPRRHLTRGVELIRPLLQVRRSEVLGFLQAEGQDYREDSSNLSPDYTRNRIRHELIPLLAAKYNPEIVTILVQLAAQARDAFREQETHAQGLLSQAELPRAGQWIVLNGQCLGSAAHNILREMFRLLWSREGWRMGNMGFDEWNRLAEFYDGKETSMDLPDGIRARRRERVVLIGPVS